MRLASNYSNHLLCFVFLEAYDNYSLHIDWLFSFFCCLRVRVAYTAAFVLVFLLVIYYAQINSYLLAYLRRVVGRYSAVLQLCPGGVMVRALGRRLKRSRIRLSAVSVSGNDHRRKIVKISGGGLEARG